VASTAARRLAKSIIECVILAGSSFASVFGALAGPRSHRSACHFCKDLAFWSLKTRKIFWPAGACHRGEAEQCHFSLFTDQAVSGAPIGSETEPTPHTRHAARQRARANRRKPVEMVATLRFFVVHDVVAGRRLAAAPLRIGSQRGDPRSEVRGGRCVSGEPRSAQRHLPCFLSNQRSLPWGPARARAPYIVMRRSTHVTLRSTAWRPFSSPMLFPRHPVLGSPRALQQLSRHRPHHPHPLRRRQPR